ncbi:TraH family protein [Pleomorphomonas koreensis]|uniref:TraH family protein n=1 Tax=Pleomorphomonas koreensis TaxID=257440 RepID=UPI00040AE2C4|nr:TraH family protein [Pleomorphomonas koreensis]
MPIDADLVHRCADPSLTPSIVETFVKTVGSADPLSITVRSGNRIILVPAARTQDEALTIIRAHVGRAIVRVGITQIPVGIGIKDPSEVSPDLLDACSNLRLGTALFGKVWRIVLKWYGNPNDDGVMPQVLEDAFDAWQTGIFEGSPVFTAADPGPSKLSKTEVENGEAPATTGESSGISSEAPTTLPNEAGIRVDLSVIGGQKRNWGLHE